MEQNKNKKLFEQLGKCKKEISELRNQLNQVNEQKESWFEKKEETVKTWYGMYDISFGYLTMQRVEDELPFHATTVLNV